MIGALLLALVILGVLVWYKPAMHRRGPDAPESPLRLPPARSIADPPPPPGGDRIPAGLAVAFVELGSALDAGKPEPQLHGDAARHADEARRLLARQGWHRGQGRPVVQDGFQAKVPGPAWLGPGSAGLAVSLVGRELPAEQPPPAGDTTAESVSAPTRFSSSGRRPVPTVGDTVKELIAAGDVMAIPFDPTVAQTRDLVLVDRTGGQYAVMVQSGDAAMVRLDGGLVVPGRCYRIDGSVRITAYGGAVGVMVVPITAAQAVWDEAAVPTAGDG